MAQAGTVAEADSPGAPVTPAMIEAGMSVLSSTSEAFELSEEGVVTRIYRRCERRTHDGTRATAPSGADPDRRPEQGADARDDADRIVPLWAELLRQAALILAAGWIKDADAGDDAGRIIPLWSGAARAEINPEATRFSPYGAICKARSMSRGAADPSRARAVRSARSTGDKKPAQIMPHET